MYDVSNDKRQTVLPVPVGISRTACPVESSVLFSKVMYSIC